MLFSQATGRKVVSTDTATTVGIITDFVIDPRLPGVIALTLAKTAGRDHTLRWTNITAFGADAVTVPTSSSVEAPDTRVAELANKSHDLLHKRVLSTAGAALGVVVDVEFDQASGRFAALLLDDGGAIDATRLLGIGSYAAVVRA